MTGAWFSEGVGQSSSENQQPTADSHVRQLPTLRRMVRHFDFEEAERAPFEMPLNFYRYGSEDGAAAQGFPPFGTMRLTNKVAYSGNWSFEFDLDGGSLAARVPTAVLPVVPLADYAVTARVRTDGLTHARARLVAWLHDTQGNMILESRVASELIDTRGAWQAHTIEVRGDYEQAADLVIELQLLQPRQFASRDAPRDVMLDDVSGQAWFDDVTVWHLPRIDISTRHPGNLIIADMDSSPPALSVLVRDLAHEHLVGRLRIIDIDGETVHDETFPAPRMPRPRTVTIPPLSYGWYRATLELMSGPDSSKLVGRRWVDFAILAPLHRKASRPADRFGVVLADDWTQHTHDLEAIIDHLGVGSVVLPMWTRTFNPTISPERQEHLRQVLHRLAIGRLRLTMAVNSVPSDLANVLDVSHDDVLVAFAGYTENEADWRHALEAILALGAQVHQWQLGSTHDDAAFDQPKLQQLIDEASKSIARLVASPHVVVPFMADHHVDRNLRIPSRVITVPNEIRPDAIVDYAEQWGRNQSPYAAIFEIAAYGAYSQRERMLDVFFRALYGVRAGIQVLKIDAPWTIDDDGRCSPDPAFVVWRGLTEHLRGRRFVGEMDLGEARQCWLFQGDNAGDDVLVAWSRRDAGDELVMQLADNPVNVVDIFGNATTIDLAGDTPGEHRIGLRRMPVFIEGVNLPLVQFRGGFAVDPPFIPSEHRTHRHEIVLRNPWDMPLAGTLHLLDKPQWNISPRSHEFNIEAHGEVRLPLEIVLERSIIAGEAILDAEVVLQADGHYRLGLSAPVRIGLPHLDFSMAWRLMTNAETGRDDLVITQYITNISPADGEPVFADAIVRAPGVRQERRIVSGLEPGQMVIRMFHIPDGAALLAGQTIRMSVSDRNGLGRLNQELHIPLFTGAQQTAGVSDSD